MLDPINQSRKTISTKIRQNRRVLSFKEGATIIGREMHQQPRNLPAIFKMILELRKCIKIALELVLDVHVWS
jgi:hypothetical protein